MLAAVPVVITGKIDGKPFEEKTRTVVVSGSGCKLVSEQLLSIGDQMNVAMASGKRSVFATVAWIGERKGKLLDVGLDFNSPEPTFWGVMFPEEANSKQEAKSEAKSEAKPEAKPVAKVEAKTETKAAKPEPKSEAKPEAKTENKPAPAAKPAPLAQAAKSAVRPSTSVPPATPAMPVQSAPAPSAATPARVAPAPAAAPSPVAPAAQAAAPETKITQVPPAITPVVSALSPAMIPPPDPLVASGPAPAPLSQSTLGPVPVPQGDLALTPDQVGDPKVIAIRRPNISISDDGLKSLGGDLLLGMVQHLVREAFQEVLTGVLEDFDRYCTATIDRAKNAALAEMQQRITSAVNSALAPALEAGVQGAKAHLDNAAIQISMHHAQKLEASMQQALENTERALESRVTDYDERLATTSDQFCKELAQRLQQASAA